METGHYTIGTPITLETSIEVDGVLTDPLGNAVTCTVRKPGGALLTPAVERISEGVYRAIVTAAMNDTEGTWRYRFQSVQSNAAGAGERAFVVDHSVFA